MEHYQFVHERMSTYVGGKVRSSRAFFLFKRVGGILYVFVSVLENLSGAFESDKEGEKPRRKITDVCVCVCFLFNHGSGSGLSSLVFSR